MSIPYAGGPEPEDTSTRRVEKIDWGDEGAPTQAMPPVDDSRTAVSAMLNPEDWDESTGNYGGEVTDPSAESVRVSEGVRRVDTEDMGRGIDDPYVTVAPRSPRIEKMAVSDSKAKTFGKALLTLLIAGLVATLLLFFLFPNASRVLAAEAVDLVDGKGVSISNNPEERDGNPNAVPTMISEDDPLKASYIGTSLGGGLTDRYYSDKVIRPHQIQIPSSNFSMSTKNDCPWSSSMFKGCDSLNISKDSVEGEVKLSADIKMSNDKWAPASNMLAANVGDKMYVSEGIDDPVREFRINEFRKDANYLEEEGTDEVSVDSSKLVLVGGDESNSSSEVDVSYIMVASEVK